MATANPDATPTKMFDGTPRQYPVVVPRPVVIETTTTPACNCQSQAVGSGFEQKIKENPLFFVLGALLVGYLLAKN